MDLKTLINSLPDIGDGFVNSIKQELGILDEKIIEDSVKKLKLCNSCKLRKGNSCSPSIEGEVVVDFYYKVENENRKKGEIKKGCGCSLKNRKILAPNSQCPLGKFEKLIDNT